MLRAEATAGAPDVCAPDHGEALDGAGLWLRLRDARGRAASCGAKLLALSERRRVLQPLAAQCHVSWRAFRDFKRPDLSPEAPGAAFRAIVSLKQLKLYPSRDPEALNSPVQMIRRAEPSELLRHFQASLCHGHKLCRLLEGDVAIASGSLLSSCRYLAGVRNAQILWRIGFGTYLGYTGRDGGAQVLQPSMIEKPCIEYMSGLV